MYSILAYCTVASYTPGSIADHTVVDDCVSCGLRGARGRLTAHYY